MAENATLEVFEGPYIPTLGRLVVIIAVHEADSYAKAEYFVLMSDDPNFLSAHAFTAQKINSQFPELVIDREFVRRFALDAAQSTIQNHLCNLHDENPAAKYLDYDVQLHARGTTQPLISLHLHGRHDAKLGEIQQKTNADFLFSYLAALRTLRVNKWSDF